MAFDLVPFKNDLSIWDSFFETPHFHRLGVFDFGVPVDINETKDKYVVTAEIPGMGAKDFNVTLSDNVLTVKGEKKSEYQKDDDGCYCSERSYGTFSRTVRLPDDIKHDASKIKASYKDGVLKIEIPKCGSKTKQLQIAVS
jgi:HSP20 family protein